MRYSIRGYTLVEMMVGMTISLVVLASSVALFSVNSALGTKQLQHDFLRTQMNLLADTLKTEIARAGFCYDCTTLNPFILKDALGAASSILIDDSASKSDAGGCIRFAYNHNKRPGARTLDKDDARGFRLGKDAKDNPVVEVYENWNGLTNWHCGSGNDGVAGYWMDMTFERLVVESLRFQRVSLPVVGSSNHLQIVNVSLIVSLKHAREVQESLSFTVALPNVDTPS